MMNPMRVVQPRHDLDSVARTLPAVQPHVAASLPARAPRYLRGNFSGQFAAYHAKTAATAPCCVKSSGCT
jgi:hypothetical protein